ncbi:hypothetical protein L226DRAFT_539377 [Lentinus tigrinus ALCF2SS1-7]|uniref:Uncharacterized protein n=1 Tax=Lentinus tigrinus ALCF2SS1-6 TaxID=1328759 RepID=A0A5C2RUB7_9APHY|nr:hypothetical protein L227DRAFT_580180 [Lentinus tigrinus ALCF2SS1-6]RPD69931.1 hypothetical protein L226DRAFT_539377 [Lentinus tigrinus ALCF2SS1-7]
MSSSTTGEDRGVHEPTEIQTFFGDDEHVERTGTWSYSFAPDPLPDHSRSRGRSRFRVYLLGPCVDRFPKHGARILSGSSPRRSR